SDRVSHWRVLWCPAGTGHALFIRSKLANDRVRVYSDNIAVARWLQGTIETLLYAEFADAQLPVIYAEFDRSGDPHSSATETVMSAKDEIMLTWHDFLDPFVLNAPPGFNNRPLGVFSTFFPARSAQLSINGDFASGRPWLEMRGDRQASSSCLAWSETWVKP
ncbi:MAG: hypothetical protein HY682_00570, partial [Chloroflexi bacterium]|nr:hypothetical protein [Chloroflexota bacterium]